MKRTTYSISAIILTIGLVWSNQSTAQTVVFGHLSAEVIESVSAPSPIAATISSFNLTVPNSNSSSTAAAINLGSLKVNSGTNVSVNVILNSTKLSDSHGNGFTLNPGFMNNTTLPVAQTNGIQNIQLYATANLDSNQPSGLYSGSYIVVLAYN